MEDKVQLSDTVRPNSYEVGKAANRHKIYYDKPEDLKIHLEALNAMGLIPDEEAE
jgi:hypothetical protein